MSFIGLSNRAIGELIRIRRGKTTLTQEDLAFEIEASRQYISDLENGWVDPDFHKLVEICIVLDIDLTEIITEYKNNVLPDLIKIRNKKKAKE